MLLNVNYFIVVFWLVIIIGIVILFCKLVIGMVDNGDFYRVISINGVYELNLKDQNLYFGYFNKEYGIYKYNNDNEKNFILI